MEKRRGTDGKEEIGKGKKRALACYHMEYD